MTQTYGPWATLIVAGQNPQLSTFWRRRLAMLAAVGKARSAPSRRSAALLAVMAISLFLLPTVRLAPLAAEQPSASNAESATSTKADTDDVLAGQLREANNGNYWAKYRLWSAYAKGAEGVEKDPEKAKKWLAQLVDGVYLAKFRPVNGFAPKTPGEFLGQFSEHSDLRSQPKGLGGASFFRTTAKDGVLIGSFLTAYPDKMRRDIAANPSLKLISVQKVTPEMFVRYEASAQESLHANTDDVLADQLREAKSGNYWAKYRLWAAYAKGAEGVEKDPQKAKKWLAELVDGVYLAKFRPANGFAPKTPQEFLGNFHEHSALHSGKTRLGGTGFFRTTAKDGVLIGSFLTEYPDKMRRDIAANPSLKLISIEKVTPEMFVKHDASPQESLDEEKGEAESASGANDFLAEQLREANKGNYWAKYRLWSAFAKGAEGVKRDPEEAKKWLAELVDGVSLVKFRPINGFAPKTPQEFLSQFHEHSALQSGQTRLGGTGFFRTTAKDGVLIGSFLTEYPDKMSRDIAANPSLKLISVEKVTPEMFVRYEASAQESLEK